MELSIPSLLCEHITEYASLFYFKWFTGQGDDVRFEPLHCQMCVIKSFLINVSSIFVKVRIFFSPL